jgi:hypothetical protein
MEDRCIAIGGDAVGAGDDEIDHAMLHQMASGIVRDHGMRHAAMQKLPGGERGALVAGSGLIDPDMDFQAALVREIPAVAGPQSTAASQPALQRARR